MKPLQISTFDGVLALHEATGLQLLRDTLEKERAGIPVNHDMAGFWDEDDYPSPEGVIKENGVAVIPIHGMMLKRNTWWRIGTDHWSWIVEQLTLRTDIETIIGDFDTGGGTVAGTERLGDAFWKARQAGKNTIAVVNEFCASAGLWVASQCERIVIPSTASIGSLGAYRIHHDESKWLADQGIEQTIIYRGKYKALDERSLDSDGKEELQRYIDQKYSLFVDAVSRGRGRTAEEVTTLWGNAQMWSGSEAVGNGLADEIGTLQDVLDSLKAGRGGRVSIESPAGSDPEDFTHSPDDQQKELAMTLKINSTGQVLDNKGAVLGTLSDVITDAATVVKFFGPQVNELIDSAVKTAKDAAEISVKASITDHDKARIGQLEALVAAVGPDKGVAAFKAGKSVVEAKAETADDLAAQLAAKEKELAELKAGKGGNAGTVAPKFLASDSGTQGNATKPAGDNASDPDAEFAAAYEKDGAGFPSLKAFAAYQRFEARQAEK